MVSMETGQHASITCGDLIFILDLHTSVQWLKIRALHHCFGQNACQVTNISTAGLCWCNFICKDLIFVRVQWSSTSALQFCSWQPYPWLTAAVQNMSIAGFCQCVVTCGVWSSYKWAVTQHLYKYNLAVGKRHASSKGSSVYVQLQWHQPAVLHSSTGQLDVPGAKSNSAVHWYCLTAHQYEGQISIGGLAVTQACCFAQQHGQ